MTTAAAYILKAYSSILSNQYCKIHEVGYQCKEGSPIPSFDEDLLIELCSNVQLIFEKEDNVLVIKGDLIIVGDIHGSFHDLLRILKYTHENDSKVLFLGDYVDRGNFSLECITILYALKVMYPDQYYLIRGNHEFDTMCSQYGFKSEIIDYHNPKKMKIMAVKENSNLDLISHNPNDEKRFYLDEEKGEQCDHYFFNHKDADCYKYSEKLYYSFIKSFNYLPIGAIVNETNFCIHGGLSPRLKRVSDIQTDITRPISNFEENQLLTDIIWSDPASYYPFLFGESPRGRGYMFNSNATDNFLLSNILKRIIRGHQCVKSGFFFHFNNECITVFSSSSYSKEMGNDSGILKLFQKDDKTEFISFPPLKRLKKIDTVYYKVQKFNEKLVFNNFFSIIHPKLSFATNLRIHCSHRRSYLDNQQLPMLTFITNSRKCDSMITKQFMNHSSSFNNLINEIKSNHINSSIPAAKSMHMVKEDTENVD